MEKFGDILEKVFVAAKLERKKDIGRYNLAAIGLLLAFGLLFHFVDSARVVLSALAGYRAEPSVGDGFWWTLLVVAVLCPIFVFWVHRKKTR